MEWVIVVLVAVVVVALVGPVWWNVWIGSWWPDDGSSDEI